MTIIQESRQLGWMLSLVLAGFSLAAAGDDVRNVSDAERRAQADAQFWIGQTGPTGPIFSGPRQYPFYMLNRTIQPGSAAGRQPMQKTQGRAGNQAIWIGAPPYNPTGEALARVDDWLNNLHRYPWAGVTRNKPAGAMDKCFDQTGRTLAAGDNVWDGILDPRPEGACTRIFHPYATSRMQAGGDLAGDVFKCQTMPLDAARARGIYAAVSFTPQEWARLAQIFPQGVCDNSLPDAGLPPRD